MMAAMTSFMANAEQRIYNDQLKVTINSESNTQQAQVIVEPLENGNINFYLNNFCLESEEATMPVGNIVIEDLPLTKGSQYDTFAFQGSINITEGDMEDAEFWLGPMLGPVPLDMKGKITDEKLYVTIDIDMSGAIGQIIEVKFGSDIEDGIAAVMVSRGEGNEIYDLVGRRISRPVKGIYVINGRKVVR